MTVCFANVECRQAGKEYKMLHTGTDPFYRNHKITVKRVTALRRTVWCAQMSTFYNLWYIHSVKVYRFAKCSESKV